MAKLKIPDGGGHPIAAAYISVAEKVYRDQQALDAFVEAEPTERPGILQGLTGGPSIKQVTAAGAEEVISAGNCRIIAEKDVQRVKKRSTVSMFIPTAPVADFTYLKDYTKVIHKYYQDGLNYAGGLNGFPHDQAQADAAFANANKFMFGAMLLTHCR